MNPVWMANSIHFPRHGTVRNSPATASHIVRKLDLCHELDALRRAITMKTFATIVALCVSGGGFFGLAHGQSTTTIEKISSIAAASQCAAYEWKDRGVAPVAYMKGIAIVYARAVCHPERPDVKAASSPVAAPGKDAENSDGLSWYRSRFSAAGISKARNSKDYLRQTYVLLLGLGMRESSGQHCIGRDTASKFESSEGTTAGLFQASLQAHDSDPSLDTLYAYYKSNPNECLLDIFKKDVSCTLSDWKNWGTGEGAEWQKFTKICPAFATDFAAVVLRKNGGHEGQFGPIVERETEILPACDAMLHDVQKLLEKDPKTCADLH